MSKSKDNLNTEFFYFEPQTGIVKSTPIKRSNYYVFRLAKKHLAKVQIEINKADLRNEGFVYNTKFIKWLHENEHPEVTLKSRR